MWKNSKLAGKGTGQLGARNLICAHARVNLYYVLGPPGIFGAYAHGNFGLSWAYCFGACAHWKLLALSLYFGLLAR